MLKEQIMLMAKAKKYAKLLAKIEREVPQPRRLYKEATRWEEVLHKVSSKTMRVTGIYDVESIAIVCDFSLKI